MLARDKERLEALRNIKKVLIEAKTAKSGNEDLPDEVGSEKPLLNLQSKGHDSA